MLLFFWLVGSYLKLLFSLWLKIIVNLLKLLSRLVWVCFRNSMVLLLVVVVLLVELFFRNIILFLSLLFGLIGML